MIGRYRAGELDAETFTETYLETFKTETGGLSEATYRILQTLFAEADAYCADPALRDEWDIDEAELREAVADADTKLEARAQAIGEE
nr:colicin immunity domain-containing protein [Natronobiforma cellulositropha]